VGLKRERVADGSCFSFASYGMRPTLTQLARRKVVVLDGAMGSNLQTRQFDLQRDWMGH